MTFSFTGSVTPNIGGSPSEAYRARIVSNEHGAEAIRFGATSHEAYLAAIAAFEVELVEKGVFDVHP